MNTPELQPVLDILSRRLRVIAFALLFIFASSGLLAQTVSGIVTDSETDEPLVGVNVLVKGTTVGEATGLDGRYSLTLPDGAETLVFSYTGFTTREILILQRSVIDVEMTAGAELDEVIVVGYGSVRKADATGAVVGIGEKDFNVGVISSAEQLIQGRAAGVQITTASGEPGAGAAIRIRGVSSVRSGNEPLIVVDGVPLSGGNTTPGAQAQGLGAQSARNPLNFLNPSDILSMDILKDASATAIYGARGANGVILITTKSGAGSAGTLEYGYSVGVSNITKKYDLLSASEYLAAYTTFNGAEAAASLNGGAETDWQEELLRTAITQNHNFAFGGSTADSDYRISLGYMDQQGIVDFSGMQRLTGRFNGNKSFLENRLRVGTQFTVASTHDDYVPITDNSGFRGDLWGNALKANPTQPVMKDGAFNQLSTTEPNPVAMLELSDDFSNTLRTLGNFNAEIDLIEGLKFRTVVGFDRSFSNRRAAYSSALRVAGVDGKGRATIGDVEINDRLWENYFTYNKGFGNIDLDGLVGYSYQQFTRESRGYQLTNFRTDDLDLMLNNITSIDVGAGNSIVPANSASTSDEIQSFFGRVNLGIMNKYIVTGTLRADGSTRFGPGNQYGVFPSFAVKWKLDQEAFIPDAIPELALRIGYGLTGNQEIPHNQHQQRQQYGGYGIDEGGNVGGGGFGDVSFANPNLKWESTTSLSVGLDFALLDYRLTGSIDWYNKNTNDLLILVTAAQPAVQPFIWDNLDADVINTGIELALNATVVNKPGLTVELIPNIAFNNNTVKNFAGLINTGQISGQGLTGAFAQRIAEGQPLYAYFLRDFGGYDAEGITVYTGGDFQKFTGQSPTPTVIAGLTASVQAGPIDASMYFTGNYGHSIYDNTANAFFTAGSLANGRNVSKEVVGNGESNLNAPDVSTRFLQSGNFTRLQTATIGYTFNPASEYFSGVRVYATGQNLLLFTNYTGQDPEVDIPKGINGVPSFGIDYTAYPRARTFSFGANITF